MRVCVSIAIRIKKLLAYSRGDITKRIVCTIPMILVIFIFTVILAMVDSSSWPDIFFWITIITIVILHSKQIVYIYIYKYY